MAQRMLRIRAACFSMVVGQVEQHLVEASPGLSGLDHRDEQLAEDLRVLRARPPTARSRAPRRCRTSPRTAAELLVLDLAGQDARAARTTDRPESIIVASWRVATATSASFTRLVRPGMWISVLRLTLPFGVTEMGR